MGPKKSAAPAPSAKKAPAAKPAAVARRNSQTGPGEKKDAQPPGDRVPEAPASEESASLVRPVLNTGPESRSPAPDDSLLASAAAGAASGDDGTSSAAPVPTTAAGGAQMTLDSEIAKKEEAEAAAAAAAAAAATANNSTAAEAAPESPPDAPPDSAPAAAAATKAAEEEPDAEEPAPVVSSTGGATDSAATPEAPPPPAAPEEATPAAAAPATEATVPESAAKSPRREKNENGDSAPQGVDTVGDSAPATAAPPAKAASKNHKPRTSTSPRAAAAPAKSASPPRPPGGSNTAKESPAAAKESPRKQPPRTISPTQQPAPVAAAAAPKQLSPTKKAGPERQKSQPQLHSAAATNHDDSNRSGFNGTATRGRTGRAAQATAAAVLMPCISELSRATTDAFPLVQALCAVALPGSSRAAGVTSLSPNRLGATNNSTTSGTTAAILQPPMRHGNPADTREASPTGGARNADVVVDPVAMARVMEEKRKARDMRKERRRREREKLALELEAASRQAEEAALARDRERQRREEELRDRLDVLRERKAQRELEFLVSEKRAQQVRASKSLADIIQEQYDAKVAAEEEERQRQLEDRRKKLHAPVVSGLEAIERHFQVVEERKRRKAEELLARREAIEQSQPPETYHGPSYELAVEHFVKYKNAEEDAKHQRLYKFAKMQEYGNLVKRLHGPAPAQHPSSQLDTPTPQHGGASPSPPPPPFITNPNHVGVVVSPVVRRESKAPDERNKTGNNYLREALAQRPPPGLKLAPLPAGDGAPPPHAATPQPGLGRDVDFERFKERKKKGDAYLREIRGIPKRTHSSPQSSQQPGGGGSGFERRGHVDSATDGASRELELKRLKAKTASLENRLYNNEVDVNDPEACLQSNEQYLEMVRLKLEMLRRAEDRSTRR